MSTARKSTIPTPISQKASPAPSPPKKPPSPKPVLPPLLPRPLSTPKPKIAVGPSAAPSSSTGGTGALATLPARTLSQAISADKNWKKLASKTPATSSSSEAMDTSAPPELPQLTPINKTLHPTTIHQVLMQSTDPRAVQMSLNVLPAGGGQGDHFNLDLAGCSF